MTLSRVGVNRESKGETEDNNEEQGLDASGKMAAVLGHFCSHQAGVFFTTE